MERRISPKIIPELIVLALLVFFVLGLIRQSPIPTLVGYRLAGTPAPSATPIPTAIPPSGTIYLKLPAGGILQLESFSHAASSANRAAAQLVIVVKKTTSTQSGATITQHVSEEFCVNVEAFLGEGGQRTGSFADGTTRDVLIILKIEDLARYAEAIPDKEQLYLVPDPACQNIPTQTQTPISP